MLLIKRGRNCISEAELGNLSVSHKKSVLFPCANSFVNVLEVTLLQVMTR